MANYRTRTYDAVPPPELDEVQCSVCGAGIEEDKTTETEQTIINYVTEGTVWHATDPTQVDVKVTVTIPPWTNCWFCGSNRWRNGGKRGSL